MESEIATAHNVRAVRAGVRHKLDYSKPYFFTRAAVEQVVTDMDHFPYRRFFRGEAGRAFPVVLEREAGFRPRRDACYRAVVRTVPEEHALCWQPPCSTVIPCASPSDVPSMHTPPALGRGPCAAHPIAPP